MNRIKLNNTERNWFDLNSRQYYWTVDRDFCGEQLSLTASGNWVLNEYSKYSNGGDVYNLISEQEAFDWMIENERAPHEDYASVKKRFDQYASDFEK